MCKLWNRIVYGNSSQPKYIRSKNSWLYKNKWVSDSLAYDILADRRLAYSYSLCTGEFASFGDVSSFAEIVSLVKAHPTAIQFPDYTQFSTQELAIIAGIQQKFIDKKREEIVESIEKMKNII